jgi:4-amino-4-deoxy-L-arabinose transferase-like glycosyltransferase
MRSSTTPRYAGLPVGAIALVSLLILLVWFGTLDTRILLRSDEGRYAEIAREMFMSGDWVTIRYNAVKYFEKPPFHMWVTALTYTLAGVGEWQARLCVALSGLLGALVSMQAAARWYGARAGLLTGLVLAASPMWLVPAHFNSLDMTLSGAMACVLAFMLLAQHPDATPAARRNWMLACWAAMGVAILTKGLVGLALPGLVLVVYSLVTRDFALWRRLHLIKGVAVMLLVTVPWFWLVSERNPEFLRFFFIHEHWDRYTSTVHSRRGAIWYFVPLLVAGFLPWLGLLPRMWQVAREHAPALGSTGERPLRAGMLAALWAIAIFVFFSLSGSKLPGYIVPVFPALGILAGAALDLINDRSWRRQVNFMLVLSVIGLVACPVVASLSKPETPVEIYRLFALWLAAAFVIMLAGGLVARRLLRTHGVWPSIVACALAYFLAFTVALQGHDVMGRRSAGIALVAPVRAVLTADMPFYGVRMLDHTLPFYLRHTLTMVAEPDELEFGVQQEPQKWLPTVEAFVERWRDGPHALAVMGPDTYEALRHDGLAMYPIAADNRRIVVSNFDPKTKTPEQAP